VTQRWRTLPPGNLLLNLMPDGLRDRVVAKGSSVPIRLGQTLFHDRDRLEAVYFPLSGGISRIVTLQDGTSVEVSVVGREGAVGLPLFVGGERRARFRALVQLDGDVLMVDADQLDPVIEEDRPFRDLLSRYTVAVLTETAQSAACNRAHTTLQRLARWLLQMHDRTDIHEFRFTQEFLGQILGVRRESVTVAVGDLSRRRALASSRGHLRIADRDLLEEAACECYGVITGEFDRLLG
jgi:CRP-like cAMP-binding protein